MRREKPLILFLSETRLSSNGIELLRVQLGMKGALGIKGGNTGGGLALLWKVEIDIHIQSYSLHHIDSVI
jgi:formyltetrahydrofolate synthetase